MKVPRGRALGGTSNLNAMMYIRGNPSDYDKWASISKDPIWSWTSVLQFFKKQEDYNGHFPNGTTGCDTKFSILNIYLIILMMQLLIHSEVSWAKWRPLRWKTGLCATSSETIL